MARRDHSSGAETQFSRHRAKARFGQNFLTDHTVIAKIVDALDVKPDEHLIEIGPGEGAVTAHLLKRGARVTAIEIDRDLQLRLEKSFAGEPFRLIKGDVLTTDLAALAADETAKVVGNLPYNISTPILTRLIAARSRFTKLVLMFQREVVDRLVAPAGSSDRGMMSVLAQAAFDFERVTDVPPTAFRPSPKVWSSVVEAFPRDESFADEPAFRTLLSRAFAQKRKTLANNLKQFCAPAELSSASSIDLMRRAETLDFDEWSHLYDAFKKMGPA